MLNEALAQSMVGRGDHLLHRIRPLIISSKENCIQIDGQSAIDFSSNDYLGLKKHPKITEVLMNAVEKYGFGSGASAFISGYSIAHKETEVLFAEWLGVDKAILFNSGYAANIGIIRSLVQRNQTVLSDKLCHASLLDGIALCRARHCRYHHNDMDHLAHVVQKIRPELIVTESVFSMEGRITPIRDIVNIAHQYNARLIIDDAHGIGVLGQAGKGICEACELTQNDYACLVLPLGKAFNAMGGVVAGKSDAIETILQSSKSYMYTTALPPAICLGIQASLKVIQTEDWRRKQLREHIQFFIAYTKEKGIHLTSYDETPIKSIVVNDNKRVMSLQRFLLSKGFFVPAIRSPTVPHNKARLRVSINSLHQKSQIMQLIDTIALGLRKC